MFQWLFLSYNKTVIYVTGLPHANHGWLAMIETVHLLDPQCRILVCLWDLRDVYGSIEAQHQRTLLLNFPDHMAPHSAYGRADTLFKSDGVIGKPLKALENLQNVTDDTLKPQISYITLEGLLQQPLPVMNAIYQWVGLSSFEWDPDHLSTRVHESDSYYRFKYRHRTEVQLHPAKHYSISPRIEREILKSFAWYYQHFYPQIGK